MNIKEAKEQIKNAITAYFSKNEYGEYEISIEKQRPIFMIGAPGVGKTAIVEQIAAELNVGLVSYSMTHHTRQSAIGLPFIQTKTYGGKEYSVSEYTMSEIIASVYDMMEETGYKEGLLFLDEINCVSETLAPSMLQFLQYKIFGRHRVPDGWIVVTAGNPPEYNNSVREFDIVTWDRMKRVDVEANYDVWKEYAYKKGIHPSITTYLDIKKDNFYKIETTVDGKSFVTARGWSDLSDMIRLYERNNIKVNEQLVIQYLQNKKIAKDFAIYYDLFNKYKSDYQVNTILEGNASEDIKSKAMAATFDEKLSLLGLIIEALMNELKVIFDEEQILRELLGILKDAKIELEDPEANATAILEKGIDSLHTQMQKGKRASSMSDDNLRKLHGAIKALEDEIKLLKMESNCKGFEAFKILKKDFDDRADLLKKHVAETKKHLSNVFAFCDEVFVDGQEILILVTELTLSFYSAHFISRYGCEEYFAHNKELLFYERHKEIIKEIEELNF